MRHPAGSFPAGMTKNPRQYAKYCLRLLSGPAKKSLDRLLATDQTSVSLDITTAYDI